jgi:general secretion pathway protein A
MYESFYNLKSRPFTLSPDPEYLFLSSKHKTALVYLEYGLMDQAGFLVITGEIGTGKTTLIKYFLGRVDSSTTVAHIFNTNVTPQQFLKAMLQELEIPCQKDDKVEILNAINRFLIKKYGERHKVVLVVDEAQNLSLSSLEEIRMLSNLQTEKEPLLQIVLLGQPHLREKLRHPELRQFAQRITVNYHLMPLDFEETRGYIHHRLKVAKAQDSDLFTEEAIKVVFQYSKGIPRVINILCDGALVYGYAEEIKEIDREIIERVVKDKKKGGIFDSEQDHETGELSPPISSSEGLKDRLSNLERQVSDLQQKVLTTLDGFSQSVEQKRTTPNMSGTSASGRLEDKFLEEREKNRELLSECARLRGQVEYLTKRECDLKDEIDKLKQATYTLPNRKKTSIPFLHSILKWIKT